MKICPVCKSTLFDDMDVCYGCMHRFEGEDGLPEEARSVSLEGSPRREGCICPVCKSTLFDDMDVCYGCMHRFEGEDGLPEEARSVSLEGSPRREGCSARRGGEDPPGFLVRVEVRDYRDDRTMWSMELVPRTTPTHGFLVRVEVRDYRDDRTMWSMELVPRTTPTHGIGKGGGGVRNEEGAPAGGAPSREDGDGDLFSDVD